MLTISSWGNHQLLKEKILSIPEHISNTHTFPDNTCHKACAHTPLTGTRSRAWLRKDSMVHLVNVFSILIVEQFFCRRFRKLDVQSWEKITAALLSFQTCLVSPILDLLVSITIVFPVLDLSYFQKAGMHFITTTATKTFLMGKLEEFQTENYFILFYFT